MGDSTNIPTRANGQTVTQEWPNILQEALSQDFVPRNTSGVPTTDQGGLGTSALYWSGMYARILNLSAQSRILANGSNIDYEILGSVVARVSTDGVDLEYIQKRPAPVSPYSSPTTDLGIRSVQRVAATTGVLTSVPVTRLTSRGGPIFVGFYPEGTVTSGTGTDTWKIQIQNVTKAMNYDAQLSLPAPTSGASPASTFNTVWFPGTGEVDDGDLLEVRIRQDSGTGQNVTTFAFYCYEI